MKIEVQKQDILKVECDVLVVNLFEGVDKPHGATGAVDKALDGAITREINKRKFKGKLGQLTFVQTHGAIPASEVCILGLGKKKELDAESIRKAFSEVIKRLKNHTESVVTILHGAGIGKIPASISALAITESSELTNYHFGKYKSDIEPALLENVVIVEKDAVKVRQAQKGIDKGIITAASVNFARDLVNDPSSSVTPTSLAKEALQFVDKNIKVRVIDRAEAKKLGMNAFLAVSSGSHEEPKFIHLTYKPASRSSRSKFKKIGIVGKAITFDSGGLNIKSEAGKIHEMKMDMGGAAVVLAIFKALAVLKPNTEVHGFIAACENMPGGGAYRPGDIVKSMSGKTIEITNTDAEGRVTLADALFFADSQGLDEIIDLATLTGACMVALGTDYAGLFGRPSALTNKIKKTFAESGELVWELPLAPEYKELNSSTWGDIKNAEFSRYGGAITAALFLQEFVKPETPWAHLDIAGPAFSYSERWYTKKEGTGFGVRGLIEYLNQ